MSDGLVISLLNGLSYGLLLFMLSAGLTLIFSLMGVLNFAHASFYMLGAYVGCAVSAVAGFWLGLLLAPLLVGALGGLFERTALRRVRPHGHLAELLATFGLAYVLLEAVQLVWGRGPLDHPVPPELAGPLLTVGGTQFPLYRGFVMLAALLVWAALALALARSRMGLLIRAALGQPHMVEALGHNLPAIYTGVFAAGAALAGLAGALGGPVLVTEPGMAATVGSLLFVVVVVGGLGSLAGALVASLLLGVLQTLAVAVDTAVLGLRLSQVAPMLPYALLVLVLALRPRGLMGRRET